MGEIYDERDRPERHAVQVTEGEILVDGTAELRLVEEFLNVELPGKPTDPVNLWILERIEYIPAVNERFTIDGLEVMVEKASRHRIRQVRISLPKETAPSLGVPADDALSPREE